MKMWQLEKKGRKNIFQAKKRDICGCAMKQKQKYKENKQRNT